MAKAVKVKAEQKVLLKWSTNWADEMDVEGYVMTTKDKSDDWRKKLKQVDYSFSLQIGTNEDIEYSSGEDLISEVVTKNLTDEEYIILKKYFGTQGGHTEFWDGLEYVLEDLDDEDDLL
jgi:hypothetical protein